jgi:ABC-type branched-subunit amino acid transport system substrate-binding protein
MIDLAEETGVPWIGASVDPSGRRLNNVMPHSVANTSHTGPFQFLKDEYPNVQRVGFMFADVGGVRANAPSSREAIKRVGFQVVYDSGISATSPDYTAEIISMRNAGAQMVYLFAVEVNQHVRVARNMRQQNFEPALKVANIGYNSKLTELLGDLANGWKNHLTYLPMLNEDEPARAPALADFLKWNRQVFPSAQIDLFPVNGWAYAALFVRGLRAIGGNVTRERLIEAINAIPEDNGGGIVARFSPKEGRSFGCFVLVAVQNRKWVREHPADGYECAMGEAFAHRPPG